MDAIYRTTGEHDLVVKIFVPDIRSLDEFLTRKVGQISGVEHIRNDIIIDKLRERHGFTLRPGLGVRLFCTLCNKQIEATVVKKAINNFEYFFCSQTCADAFQK